MRITRTLKSAFALIAVATSDGCYLLEAVAGTCTQEQLVVTWPLTVTRGTSVTHPLATETLTPQNVDPAQFNLLRQLLTDGGTGLTQRYSVTWTVSAFDVNGGYIALVHDTPFASVGETRQITSAFAGGGWGVQPVTSTFPASISLRADNFTATSATARSVFLLQHRSRCAST